MAEPEQESRWWIVGLAALAVAALLPRVLEHVSRADLWYQRSIRFYGALGSYDWASTYQQYHPGVTTMWIAGGALAAFRTLTGATPEELLQYDVDATGIGVAALAVVIVACLVGAVVLLRSLFGGRVAWIAGALLAFDPFLLVSSKVLHVDALLACFVLLSVLAVLRYQRSPSAGAVVWIGVFAGLALLTKSPALLLLPFCAVGMAGARWARRADGPWFRRTILDGLLLVGILVLVTMVSFPAMWVEPLEVVERVLHAVFLHADRPHSRPIFFWGSTSQDPGLLYYPVVVAYRATFVSLPMALLAAGAAAIGYRRLSPERRTSLLSIAGFVLFFGVVMAISDKKSQRYILPVLPLLDVLAAVGITMVLDALSTAGPFRRPAVQTALAVLLVAAPAAFVLRHHPFYGLHANALLGGSRAADGLFSIQDQAEGADRAAAYLNSLPDAENLRVAALGAAGQVMKRTFVGELKFRDPDYRVYFRQPFLRGLAGADWERCRVVDAATPPVWALEVDGVRHLWIQRVRPEDRGC